MSRRIQLVVASLLFLLVAGPAAAQDDDAFRIVQPEAGATVQSGDTVTVEVAGRGLQEVTLMAPGYSETRQPDKEGKLVFEYAVPPTTFGEIELTAFGRDEDDRFVNTTATMTVVFNPEHIAIDRLRVRPRPIRLQTGASVRLTVTATLANGGEMDVSATRFGTHYEVSAGAESDAASDPVASVDETGTMQGLRAGEATLTVSHDKAEEPVTVQVVVTGGAAGNDTP